MTKEKKTKNSAASKVTKITSAKTGAAANSNGKGANIIVLKELMDITYAEKLLAEMTKYINSASGNIVFDASEVTRLTTPCVQVILSASKEAQHNGLKIVFDKVSEAFEKTFNDLGLQNELTTMKG